MNILICCEFYYPSVGGVEKVSEQLAENFASKGHKKYQSQHQNFIKNYPK